MQPTLLTDIGEYQAHIVLEGLLNIDGERSIGDDCAVYELANNEVLLVNIDRLASNVEEYNRARLCVVQTLSDIICMGGVPESFLVALTLPRSTTLQSLKNLTEALQTELASYGARLVGGDTKEGPAFHMVGVGLGRAHPDYLVRRIGAQPGMLVGVTSTAGLPWGARWAHAVTRELGLRVPSELAELCAQADRAIRLPYAESQAAIGTGLVRAGLDLSDGIGGGLRLLARTSKVGLDVDRAALATLVDRRLAPVSQAMDLPIECFALSPGYNWENMYVIAEEGASTVVDAVRSAGGAFTVIGHVEHTPGIRIDRVNVAGPRLPTDEKFAKDHTWENRFTTWQENCRQILGGSDER
jgi:thiamin-phosphate kinase